MFQFNLSPPNQSLPAGGLGVSRRGLDKMEPAVDDFAVRQYAENDMISRYIRTIDYIELAARRPAYLSRCSLAGAPVR
ncbi:MAG: hypothetical protein WBZ48_01830 [Bacteroidota bacterium]